MSFRQDGNEICVKYEQQKLVVKAIRAVSYTHLTLPTTSRG